MNGTPYTKEDDAIIKKYAGKKPVSEVCVLLGRTKHSLYNRIRTMDIKYHLLGESHWKAKISNTHAKMIQVLYDSGFTPKEIHLAFSAYSYSAIYNIANSITRTSLKSVRI